jgi:hypothetical protein
MTLALARIGNPRQSRATSSHPSVQSAFARMAIMTCSHEGFAQSGRSPSLLPAATATPRRSQFDRPLTPLISDRLDRARRKMRAAHRPCSAPCRRWPILLAKTQRRCHASKSPVMRVSRRQWLPSVFRRTKQEHRAARKLQSPHSEYTTRRAEAKPGRRQFEL